MNDIERIGSAPQRGLPTSLSLVLRNLIFTIVVPEACHMARA